MNKPRITQLRAVAKRYQVLLGLVDWQITVNWATKQDFADRDCYPDALGSCSWQVEYHTCRILLNRNLVDAETAESTVIHELIHLLAEQSDNPKGKYAPHYERALNTIADLLWQWDVTRTGGCGANA